ncbi:hypothetical protein BDFG_03384 [Blastomyces dermatitidis ATCC 26199]|nr:hypothetical protein BDFG_03384 [Blastomyces dermatitidis ATCC 26199]
MFLLLFSVDIDHFFPALPLRYPPYPSQSWRCPNSLFPLFRSFPFPYSPLWSYSLVQRLHSLKTTIPLQFHSFPSPGPPFWSYSLVQRLHSFKNPFSPQFHSFSPSSPPYPSLCIFHSFKTPAPSNPPSLFPANLCHFHPLITSSPNPLRDRLEAVREVISRHRREHAQLCADSSSASKAVSSSHGSDNGSARARTSCRRNVKPAKSVQFGGVTVHEVNTWIKPGVHTQRDPTTIVGKLVGWSVTPLEEPEDDEDCGRVGGSLTVRVVFCSPAGRLERYLNGGTRAAVFSLGMELIITKGGMQKYTLRSVKGYGRSWDYTLRSAVVAQESPSNGMVDDQRDYTLWSVVVAKESPLKEARSTGIYTSGRRDTEPTKLRFGASRATEEKGLYASERSSGE